MRLVLSSALRILMCDMKVGARNGTSACAERQPLQLTYTNFEIRSG